ncbi:isoprenylcysteine carboxylmethyltransferase family protein [Mucilaginibacter endophyticus]|uniref:isoprenylcysteine carboxylmethyltransferase family protein n=1 Tax=Mucilaginibacter endophyticus TaxID=2675003 RepID=UPI003CC669CD
MLITLHFVYYLGCFFEAYLKRALANDPLTYVGLILYIFSIIVLYYVIFQLRRIWTVKLIIGPSSYHRINSSFLFRHIRHPNYYLNIIPELISLSLFFHAWYSFAIGFPLYILLLFNRIKEENNLMRQHFNI